jgi:hypothetical protein
LQDTSKERPAWHGPAQRREALCQLWRFVPLFIHTTLVKERWGFRKVPLDDARWRGARSHKFVSSLHLMPIILLSFVIVRAMRPLPSRKERRLDCGVFDWRNGCCLLRRCALRTKPCQKQPDNRVRLSSQVSAHLQCSWIAGTLGLFFNYAFMRAERRCLSRC